MHAGHHVRPALLGKHVDLRLGVAAHEQEDGVRPHIRNESNGVVGEPLPQGHVAARLARRHRQGRVEQADVLGLEPPGEVAVLEGVRVWVLVLELLEDVMERGRDGRHGRRHREGQAHGLVRQDVRVLAENQHLHLGGVHFEDAKDVGFLGVDRGALIAHLSELVPDLLEAHLLSLEERCPRRVHFGGVHVIQCLLAQAYFHFCASVRSHQPTFYLPNQLEPRKQSLVIMRAVDMMRLQEKVDQMADAMSRMGVPSLQTSVEPMPVVPIVDAAVAPIKADVDEVKAAIEPLKAAIAEIKALSAALKEELVAVAASIADVASGKADAADVVAIKADVAKIQADVAEL